MSDEERSEEEVGSSEEEEEAEPAKAASASEHEDEEEVKPQQKKSVPAPQAPPAQSAEESESLAWTKRRQQQSATDGDDDFEMLEQNKQERKKMEDSISEIRARAQRRKQEREEQERRFAEQQAEEQAKRKVEEMEIKKKKEEEEMARKEKREKQMAEFEKLKNPQKPNFIISKREGGLVASDQDEHQSSTQKTKEQLEAEKKNVIAQRLQPLSIEGFDEAKLKEKAKELHNLITKAEGEKYDLEQRFKKQQVEMNDLMSKARQKNKGDSKGRGTQAAQEGDAIQQKIAGCPPKINMVSVYERQKDKRSYTQRRDLYSGPTWRLESDRIKASRTLVWTEDGRPAYAEGEEGEGHHAEENEAVVANGPASVEEA